MTKIGVVVGSLRKESYARKWSVALAELFPADVEVEFLEIGNLPLYNEEYDENNPSEYTEFRNAVSAQDAIIFATPEYNRSTSGVLKNAIDVASRPWGQSVWTGKPALILGHSISNISGANAVQSLRPTLAFLDMPVLGQPEVYLANSQNFFDEDGKLNNEETRGFLQTVADAFIAHIEKNTK
ncbi:NAD(P)H-dependent oxidoreductase [Ruoffia tabacinasalis]|uniref:NAD(P)H-dependent oxidoreductase n=1 Tax=Ruoffia tabacinasalis TaxID=87458 RepID=A0A5R9DV86_9LACT|nr:NAD(P)H-dependent oxidoreductase [Ruoffia tabacinasalis]TLQ40486.1 NAD(P)H-dependent oxidoreductase [Ruoffia tabacinasalis]